MAWSRRWYHQRRLNILGPSKYLSINSNNISALQIKSPRPRSTLIRLLMKTTNILMTQLIRRYNKCNANPASQICNSITTCILAIKSSEQPISSTRTSATDGLFNPNPNPETPPRRRTTIRKPPSSSSLTPHTTCYFTFANTIPKLLPDYRHNN
jgi:hypothetical protein